jgi:hypothetical protein
MRSNAVESVDEKGAAQAQQKKEKKAGDTSDLFVRRAFERRLEIWMHLWYVWMRIQLFRYEFAHRPILSPERRLMRSGTRLNCSIQRIGAYHLMLNLMD